MKLTKKELIRRMEIVIKAKSTDIEMLHIHLDNLLLEYINDDLISTTYHSAHKWYA